ncbi:lipase/esterase, putative [Talaromyces stipitatus ATCC 10500]|uniref:Lipase/esterase, putative n=1 Tax=Talaromyces stipitatus (strain ATCC 10500 / CBS 375.48 / QM 6759 / NRRL 1006) TaxID=441959 RepID=B8M0Q9_TALSN|nr:lipase/esterase, putative [Talaromyces stipitatus ATCC 10500]EED21442.1 lipase/esterase, putative [Talaromyces stipitatus ATCC 10500]
MDFSNYGEPASEWTSYLYAHPIINQPWTKPSEEESLTEMHITGTNARAAHDQVKLKAHGLEGKFSCQDYEVGTRDGSSIPLRLYTPIGTPSPPGGRPIYVYFHGGGFLHGSIDTERSACALIATKLNIMVVHPCPRHVHEEKHPIPHHDAWDAMKWIIDHASSYGGDVGSLVIGGISSGANLAAYVVQQFSTANTTIYNENNAVRIKGQVLIVPWLIQPNAFPYGQFIEKDKTSLVQCSNALGLSTERLEWLSSILGVEDIANPIPNPALVDEKVLGSLPKTAIIIAGGDPLRDDGLIYASRLGKAGVRTKIHVFPGLPHHFAVYELPHPHVAYELRSASVCQNRVLESIQWALKDGGDQAGNAWVIEKTS